MVEGVFRKGAIGQRIVGRRGQEERITLRAHVPGELSRNDPPRAMDQLLRQNDRGRQIAAGRNDVVRDRRDRRPVRFLRSLRIKTARHLRPAGEHDVVPLGMLVRTVSERAADRPLVAAPRQLGHVLANPKPRRARAHRLELAPNLLGRVRLHVEAVDLREAPRKERCR